MRRALITMGIGLSVLASTALSAPAHASNVTTAPLIPIGTTPQQVATFWLGNGAANLKNATPYAVQTVAHGQPSSTPVVADGKPGLTAPIGAEATKPKAPTTLGKVFFVGADGQPHWCTGTSMQSNYRNLVATAGHCAFDTQSGAVTLDKWAFVPEYADGATPTGLYVGKQAFTHFDFDAYTDYGRDFAFVPVYSGVTLSSPDVLANTGRLGDNVGGQGFAWNQPTGSTADVLGFPAGPHPDGTTPYTGQTLERSTGTTTAMTLSDPAANQAIGVDSPFTGEGSLGSSWLHLYDKNRGLGYLNGITISVADTDGDNRFDHGISPYFDSQAAQIFNAAKNVWTGTIA